MEPLQQSVAAALGECAGPVFVGFSGGLDSTVLLHATATATATVAAGADRLVALHVNHRLHPDAAHWQAHCEQVAAALGVAVTARAVDVDVAGSREASARRARYAVFADCLGARGGLLLLAHHRDDQAETVLLRLLQGRGGYGMPRRRPLGRGGLVRPLLAYPRAELRRYAEAHGLRWIEDPSNLDLALDRNYLRQRLLPALRARWPGVDEALIGLAGRERAAQARLLQAHGALLEQPALPVAALLARPADEQQALLRLWLAAHGRATPSRRALAAFIGQLASAPQRQPRLDLDGASLRRFGGCVHLVEAAPVLAECYRMRAPGRLALPHGELEIVPAAQGFRVHGALRVRFRRAGETLRTGGHARSLKHLLQQSGIAPWQRDHYPLLADDRGLLAVPGVAARDSERDDGAATWLAIWHPARARRRAAGAFD